MTFRGSSCGFETLADARSSTTVFLFHLEQQLAKGHLLACLGSYDRDLAGEGRLECHLHLHRLQYAEPLALLDRIPLRDVDREQGAGHRGREAALACGRAVGREHVGSLEDEALPMDHHLDRVRGRVNDGLDPSTGDLETYDVLLGRELGDG